MNCLFCEIINGNIPSTKIYEDDKILAFLDIEPRAPLHFLVISKAHIISADDITEENADIIGHIFAKIPEICRKSGVTTGYRIITNCGEDGGQVVHHLHFHVLAKKKLSNI